MSFDGIVTRKIVNELKDLILGAKIQKIYQPSRYELVFSIYSMGKTHKLLLSANNNEARINFTNRKFENPEVPENFCMVLRKHLNQGKIIGIRQKGLDRTVEFLISSIDEMGFDKPKKLFVEIMGRHSNIILTDGDLKIIDAIKRVSSEMSSVRQIFPSLEYESISSEKVDISEDDFNRDIFSLDQNLPNSFKPFRLFHTNYEGFSPTVGKELVHRAGIDPEVSWGLVSEDEKERLNKVLLKLRDDIINKKLGAYSYKDEKKVKDFHCLDLSYLNFNKHSYQYMSEAVDEFYQINKSNDRLEQIKKNLLSNIIKHKKQVTKKISILNDNLSKEEEASDAKNKGDILAANLYRLEDKMKEVVLEDFYNDNEKIRISLAPLKSPWENINSYYTRSKKIKTSIKYAKKDLPRQKNLLDYLSQLEDFITRADSVSDLEEIREEMVENKLIKRKSRKKKKKSKKSKPLHYKTESGADIYVGKNSKQNDYITLKLARKEDLWFHVKDLPGSHVILKTDKLVDEDIRLAAYLAATNSSVSNDNKVDVDYTEKKNVNKAKGAKDGMVYYENFTTITVDTESEPEASFKEI